MPCPLSRDTDFTYILRQRVLISYSFEIICIPLYSYDYCVYDILLSSTIYDIEMATGRAGPENPSPRALRAETGLMIFYLRILWATENSNFC